ncbi:MAG: TolC family protein [Vicinamibacteria bacterium]
MSLLGIALGGVARGQDAHPTPDGPGTEAEPVVQAPPEAEGAEEGVGPTPGAPTVGLARAVGIALEHNFTLLSAGDSVASARFREGAARGEFMPKLTPRYQGGPNESTFGLDAQQRLPWSGGTVTATGNLTSLSLEGAPATKSSDVQVVLTQPLLRGAGPNATYYDLRNSQRAREGQERTYELARQRLAVDVTTTFFQVVRQRELLRVSRQSLNRSDSLRQASEARMKVGLASKLDVFRAELQSSQTQETLVQSQAALETALEQFRLLLGLDPGDPVEPETASLPDSVDLDLEPVEVLVARAVENRLEIKEARDQVRDGERSAALAKQNLLPQLDLNLGFTQTGLGPTYSDSLRVGTSRVSAYLSTSYPLERSNDKATAAIAELDLMGRRRTLAQRELDVAADVRGAVRTLERIRKSVELQRKAVAFAGQQVRLATLRYQRGLASNFDVVDAEGSLLSSRTALVGLLADFQVSRVQLLRAEGTLNVDKEFGP